MGQIQPYISKMRLLALKQAWHVTLFVGHGITFLVKYARKAVLSKQRFLKIIEKKQIMAL